MTTNSADDTDDRVAGERSGRYAELTIGDEEFVIYDRENHQAWLQSSVAIAAANLR
jgi:hypothetical protein